MTAGDEVITSVITDIRDAVKRADGIVRDLLYLSAARSLEIHPEDLNAVIRHSLCLVNFDLTRSRILVGRELNSNLPLIPMDKAKLEQVFINVFMNAIQAMPEGGSLTVKTQMIKWQAPKITDGSKLGPFATGDSIALVEIEDTGIGIPESKLQKLFVPFETTKPNGIGTGLGLPVTKQIMDLHGGSIQITPRPSGGVKVAVMLKTENNTYEKENIGSGR
jgi:signal transduction histidine kinase